jgi:hypothetical protein
MIAPPISLKQLGMNGERVLPLAKKEAFLASKLAVAQLSPLSPAGVVFPHGNRHQTALAAHRQKSEPR